MLQTWEIISFLLYGIPSFLLYIFVIYQFLFDLKLKSSFFKIAIFMSFVDLSNYIFMWFSHKLILWPLTAKLYFIGQSCEITSSNDCLPKNDFCFVILFSGMYYFNKVRECLLVTTSFNRFTAIYFPERQKTIWKKCLLPLILLSFIFPFCLIFYIFFGVVVLQPFSTPNDGTFVLYLESALFDYSFLGLISCLHAISMSGISLIFNLSSFGMLFIQSNKIPNSTKIKESEKKLLAISGVDFLMDLLAVSHQIYMYSFSVQHIYYHPILDQLYLLYPWIYDILNLSRPYIMILMCKQIQRNFIAFIGIRKPSKVQILSIKL